MDPIEALVAEFVELRERGQAPDPDEFCARHPEAGERLRSALRTLIGAERLFPAHDPPASVGAYRIVREIGRGGVGRVFVVEKDGRELALKLLHPNLELQPRALERFRRERDALARIQHPGVVRVVDGGMHDGRPFLVMEKVEGESLAGHLRRATAGRCVDLPGEGPPERRVARVVAAVADAIAAAHAAGVLHRDVNPRNVILENHGTPVVIDFGLVRTEDAASLTGTGDLLGTPPYMAPEQARGEPVDERSDVFGIGALLHELATGAPPRAGTKTIALLQQAARIPLSPPRRTNPRLPAGLDRIARRATAWRAAWRYPSARELADDLRRFAAGEEPHARAPRWFERCANAWLVHGRAIAAIAVLIVAALVLALALRGDPPSPAEIERTARELHQRAAIAWLDGDLAAMDAAVRGLRALDRDEPLSPMLAALARGELPAHDAHPAADAFLEGERARRAGRPAEALARFETAANIAPGVPLVAASIAFAAKDAGDVERAQNMLERMAAFLGPSRALHRALAEVYLARAMADDAVKAAATLVQLAPEDAGARLLEARARLFARDAAGARAALDAAATRGAEPSVVSGLRAEVDALK